jgi:hypothetical protein
VASRTAVHFGFYSPKVTYQAKEITQQAPPPFLGSSLVHLQSLLPKFVKAQSIKALLDLLISGAGGVGTDGG